MAVSVVTVGQREVQELPRSGNQRLLPDKGPADAREYGETLLGLIRDDGCHDATNRVKKGSKWRTDQSGFS